MHEKLKQRAKSMKIMQIYQRKANKKIFGWMDGMRRQKVCKSCKSIKERPIKDIWMDGWHAQAKSMLIVQI